MKCRRNTFLGSKEDLSTTFVLDRKQIVLKEIKRAVKKKFTCFEQIWNDWPIEVSMGENFKGALNNKSDHQRNVYQQEQKQKKIAACFQNTFLPKPTNFSKY